MANLVTTIRLVLLFILVLMTYLAPAQWQLLNPFLLIVIILLDAVDGYVARLRRESSVFGAVYDIAVDRVVENVLWIVLADLDLVSIWVALVFITRGLLVDAIRGHGAAQGKSAFEMLESPLGRFLVSGRFMRGFYGVIKAIVFAWLLLIQPVPALFPDFWTQWSYALGYVTDTLVLTAVATCLIRGIPVLIEFYLSEGRALSSQALRQKP